MAKSQHIPEAEACELKPGTILWLPPKDQLLPGPYTSPTLLEGAYDHPIVVVSCPPTKVPTSTSRVEIAIITSFQSTPIKSHLAQKGIHYKTGTEAAERTGYLRIVTASKPYAADVLKLWNKKGMKRDCAYVNVKQSFAVEVRALKRYGRQNEELCAYRLTAYALGKLVDAVAGYRERRVKAEESVKEEKQVERLKGEKNVVKEESGVKKAVFIKKQSGKITTKVEKFKKSQLKMLLTKLK